MSKSAPIMATIIFISFILAGCSAIRLGSTNQPTGQVLTTLPASANPTSTVTPLTTASLPPTETIVAVENETFMPSSGNNVGQVWTGTMESDTSRKYFSEGKEVNSCQNGYTTDLAFIVFQDGRISGYGDAKLTTPLGCSASQLGPNTTYSALSVSGTKDDQVMHLQLKVISWGPVNSGDFGGFALLFTQDTCNSVQRTLDVPLVNSGSAQANYSDSDQTVGCPAQSDDLISEATTIQLQYRFDCDSIPADQQESEPAGLCQGIR